MKKFKIGDRVNHALYGDGTIIWVRHYGSYTVEFDKESGMLHDGMGGGSPKGKENRCYWVSDNELKPIATPITAPNWTMVIRPDKSNPDITVATLKVGKETIRTESVKRHYKDTYDRDAAIRAIVEKMIVKPVKEVQRKAVKGEWIKVTAPDRLGRVKVGDIVCIDETDGIDLQIKHPDGANWTKGYSTANIGSCKYVVLENYRPDLSDCSTGAVGETVCSEPVKEVPKPIMIGDKELKVGSRFILKPYDKSYCGGLWEESWKNLTKHVLEANIVAYGNVNFTGLVADWDIPVTAIDRIIED